jgi:hypothetical protein
MAVKQIPDGTWVSDDGRWMWREARWIPMPAAGQTGLFWFISTPSWAPTLLLMGLIGLIPFVGTMDIYGYAIVTARNIRAGYRVLPRANFSYIGLGAPVAVLQLAWAAIALLLTLAVGSAVGFAAYGQTHSIAWAIGLAVPTGFTVLGILNLPTVPLFVPALEMSEREGWGIFRVNRLVSHATTHWRSAWYGVAIFLLWYAIYFALALVLGIIPFGSLLAAVAGLPVLAPMIATPVARFDDPPAGFGKGAANALAAAWLAILILGVGSVWGIGLVAASYVSAHPDEVACVFDPSCTFNYSGNLEAIARVRRDTGDATLVTVDVTYINRSTVPAPVDPGDYYARTLTAGLDLPPSQDCPPPQAAAVAPGGRLSQRVCFRLPDTSVGFEVHLPWIGWDSRTF